MKYRIFISALTLLFVGSAHAAGSNELNELKQKVDQLVSTNQKNYSDVAQAMNSMNEIRQEFRQIKGQLDSSQYILKESDRVYQDLDQRVSALEDKIGQMHNLLRDINLKLSSTSAAVKTPPGAALSKELEEYQALLNVVNARDYANAASGFLGFLKKYPGSENAGNAQYWVAESFYSMGDYVKAISEFQVLSEKYPSNLHVKEGLYKQGMAFVKLKKIPQAKLFFQKVMSSYPNSAEAYQAKGRLLRLEELEKPIPAVALSQPGISTAPESAPKTGDTVYRPIMKPNPMPAASPRPTVPEDERPAQDSSAPLF
ncbi:MAG TPA: tol-pal system protein YbgF [Deltaproteobacteria bacterium]|nr:tol-pal system protein YbgF [Deltaproteobacteria bacterium]